MRLLERIQSVTGNAVEKVRQNSALNPVLWLCGITILPGLLGAYRLSGPLQYVFAGLAVLPVLMACGSFLYFMLTDPDRLQSEEYQIRHETLEIISTRGIATDIDDAGLTAIMTQINQLLPSGDDLT